MVGLTKRGLVVLSLLLQMSVLFCLKCTYDRDPALTLCVAFANTTKSMDATGKKKRTQFAKMLFVNAVNLF